MGFGFWTRFIPKRIQNLVRLTEKAKIYLVPWMNPSERDGE